MSSQPLPPAPWSQTTRTVDGTATRAARSAKVKRRWMVAGLTALALVVGPVGALIVYGAMGLAVESGNAEVADFPFSPEQLLLMMVLDVAVGLVAIGLLPLALRRAPESQILDEGRSTDQQQLKEPVSALVTALVIGLLVGVSSSAFPAWFIAVISVSSRGIRRWLYWIPVVALLSAVVSFFVFPVESSVGDLLLVTALTLAMTALPVVIGLLRWSRRRQLRALRSEAATAHREAQAVIRAEQARAEKTRAEERTRIAREMHDTLSHRLALISTYAGALDYREDLDRETVRATARLVQQTASTASAELRTVLDVLREDPTDTRPEPDLRQVDDLIQQVRSTGVTVDSVVQRPDLAQIPDTISRALYRMVQEALTNAVKHAPGAPVAIRWHGDDQRVMLTVTNPLTETNPLRRGPGARDAGAGGSASSGGFGLIGLDERARALGGNVKTSQSAHEFRLEATVPCRS